MIVVTKMNNKILIQLIVPELEEKNDLFTLINRRVGTVMILLTQAINDFTNGIFSQNKKRVLYNHNTGVKYNLNQLIRETDIRNGTILVLM